MKKKLIQILFFIWVCCLLLPGSAFAFVGTVIGAVAGAALYAAGGGLASISVGLFGTTLFTITSLTGFAAAGALVGSALSYISSSFTPDVPDVGYGSSTYDTPQPVITIKKGVPIAEAYGLNRLGGNVIRQNDPNDSNWIKLIVAHCAGEIDEVLGHVVNNTIWTDLTNKNHALYEHLGAEDQSGVTNIFDDSNTCAFRGLALTEYKIKKCNELRQVQNINVVIKGRKCLEIGEDSGGTESYTNNPAQILWDFYIKKKEKTSADLDTNAFTALETYCAQVPTDGDSSELRPPICSSDLIKATSYWHHQERLKPSNALKKAKSLAGSQDYNAWLSGEDNNTNQCINIDFGVPYVIDGLIIENYHNSGAQTSRGIQNFAVQGSNTASALSNTTYSSDTGWTNIAVGKSASEHTGSDVSDPELITWTNSTAYRYIRLKIADNYGDTETLGVRDLQFIGKTSRYTFDFNFDTKMSINDAERLIWKSFHGKVIRSQGIYKPVWDGDKEHDGAGGLQNKASVFSFDEDNIVKGLFSHKRLDSPNIFICNFINAHDNFQKDMIELRDEADISDRGEIVYDETSWYVKDKSVAKRRVNFKKNKARYTDYACKLTGNPESQGIELYDLVTVTHSSPNPAWSSKAMIVIDKDEDQYGRSVFILEAYGSSKYTDRAYDEQQTYINAPPGEVEDNDSVDENYGAPIYDAGGDYDDHAYYSSSFYDGIRNTGGLIIGCCHDDWPDPAMTFDDDNTSDTIDPGDSIELYVLDGCPDFTWEVSGLGYSISGESGSPATAETSERNATLNCVGGTCGVDYDTYCTVTVTDRCGTSVEFVIKNTAGSWGNYVEECFEPDACAGTATCETIVDNIKYETIYCNKVSSGCDDIRDDCNPPDMYCVGTWLNNENYQCGGVGETYGKSLFGSCFNCYGAGQEHRIEKCGYYTWGC